METWKTIVSSENVYQKNIDTIEEMTARDMLQVPEGTAGALVIPELNYYVPIYNEWDQGGAQKIVDDADSAVLISVSAAPIIADHEKQGFEVIKNCEEGQTCHIQRGNDNIRYLCVKIDTDGVNDEGVILSSDGTMLQNLPSNLLVMYTCNDIGESITNVIWHQIEDREAKIEFTEGDGYCRNDIQAS